MYTTSRACVWIPNEKQYTTLQWEWFIPHKICTMTTCTKSINIYYSQVTLLLQCLIFLFKPIYKNNYLTIIKLDIFGKTCPKGWMQHFHLHQKGGASVRKQWVQRTGWIAFPRRVAYFLNELRQSVVHTACRHICNCLVQSLYSSASLKSFVVERPPVPKYRTSLIDSVSIPRKPYTTIWFYKLLILVLHYQHFSYHSPHFSAAEISRTTLLRYASWLNDNL